MKVLEERFYIRRTLENGELRYWGVANVDDAYTCMAENNLPKEQCEIIRRRLIEETMT